MKSVLYMAMTVNGYIAKENGETPWSNMAWKSYYRLSKKFKAIVVGRKTFEIMKEADEFKKIGNPRVIVVSSKDSRSLEATFVKTPKNALDILKKEGFKEVLIGGGGKLNSSFMKDKLIDEIYLDVESIVFGGGIKLFEENSFETKLKLIDMKKLSDNLIQLHYEVTK